jgi:hypothetical protein
VVDLGHHAPNGQLKSKLPKNKLIMADLQYEQRFRLEKDSHHIEEQTSASSRL